MHEIKNYFNENFKELYLNNNSQKIFEEDRIICKVSQNYYKNEEEEINYPIFNYYSISNNSNYKPRFVGPFKHKGSEDRKI